MRRSRGFTLIELLVAIMIFSVLAAMAYGGLRSVLTSERAIDEASQRLAAIQQTMLFISRDLAQISGRGIRDQYGDQQPALRTQTNLLSSLEFTRGGWSNPAGQLRSTLQRIGYAVEEQQLIRYSWPVLDRAPDTQPWRMVLLAQVESLRWRFMDDKGAWQDAWAQQADSLAEASLPRAVELTFELKDLGSVRRLFALNTSTVKPEPPPMKTPPEKNQKEQAQTGSVPTGNPAAEKMP
ncbi:MAG TPA: type II secretion system minor pseudopilin GspJ [Gammaproteobacteria bacterium]